MSPLLTTLALASSVLTASAVEFVVAPKADTTPPIAGGILRDAAAAALGGAGAADALAPPEPLDRPFASLKSVPVPTPSNLATFIRNTNAAVVLGKALFWDMQTGSDGVTACASCHFHAGADSRSVNTVAPALLRVDANGHPSPDERIASGVNRPLSVSSFPFHKLSNPLDRNSALVSDNDDIAGSQGVLREQFNQVVPRKAEDLRTTVADRIYTVGAANTRRVTPRNSPSVINAVFNLRNFWDGRAQDVFNGVNPFGARDRSATVLRASTPAKIEEVQVRLDHASLASQAVGPPLSDIEMSASGRSFAHLGKKVLSLRPLASQQVHPQDSVLGAYVHASGKGLNISKYQDLIQQAFQPEWWQGQQWVEVDASGATMLIPAPASAKQNQFNQMSWNFSLFFGLAIQAYESTLVSDQSPFDLFMEGDHSMLSPQQQVGMDVFQNKASCSACHSGPEFTNASVGMTERMRIERMVFASVPPNPADASFINTSGRLVVYDTGFYNIGVRPTNDDLGIGAIDPFGLPLAESKLAKAGRSAEIGLAAPSFVIDSRTAAVGDGAFKAPGLRNVELTAPYFHNGGQLTLRQVVDFYNRGGDYRDENINDVPVDIDNLNLTEYEKDAIVAFLTGLTDPRVKYERAPFDHPQLFVPNGHPTSGTSLVKDAQGRTTSAMLEVPAVGRQGCLPQPNFLAVP